MHNDQHPAPDATLFISPGCSHCPTVMADLCRLLKENRIGRLEIVNLAQHPEAGTAAGVRSVPWTRIGPFELLGAHSYHELAQWADRAAAGDGLADYYSHLLESGRLQSVVGLVRQRPESIGDLLGLLQTLETPMAVRIGVGAVLEELADDGLPQHALAPLTAMTESSEPQIRADACHYLGLTEGQAARATLRRLLQDPDPQVREIAEESLAAMRALD